MFLEVDLYVLRFGLLFFLPEIVKATAAAISASSRERERERKDRGRWIGLAHSRDVCDSPIAYTSAIDYPSSNSTSHLVTSEALTAMSLPARTSQHVESEDRQRTGEIHSATKYQTCPSPLLLLTHAKYDLTFQKQRWSTLSPLLLLQSITANGQ